VARGVAAAALLIAAGVLAGCTFNDPAITCGDVGDRCQPALDAALAELGASYGDFERIDVHPGCHSDITCPPSMLEQRVTVVLFPRDGSTPTYVAVEDDGNVILYTPGPVPAS
jgi:hypothetical protein